MQRAWEYQFKNSFFLCSTAAHHSFLVSHPLTLAKPCEDAWPTLFALKGGDMRRTKPVSSNSVRKWGLERRFFSSSLSGAAHEWWVLRRVSITTSSFISCPWFCLIHPWAHQTANYPSEHWIECMNHPSLNSVIYSPHSTRFVRLSSLFSSQLSVVARPIDLTVSRNQEMLV